MKHSGVTIFDLTPIFGPAGCPTGSKVICVGLLQTLTFQIWILEVNLFWNLSQLIFCRTDVDWFCSISLVAVSSNALPCAVVGVLLCWRPVTLEPTTINVEHKIFCHLSVCSCSIPALCEYRAQLATYWMRCHGRRKDFFHGGGH